MLTIKSQPSPNFSSRNGEVVSLLVLHYTGMQSGKEALARLCDPEAQVSSHYLIEEDGTIYQLVEEASCAWHAGVSYWRGKVNVNPISIGIEMVNPGHEFGYRPFPDIQMQSVADLSADIIKRHDIMEYNVVGHSDIAPLRKADPGEWFDWSRILPSFRAHNSFTAFLNGKKALPIPMDKLHAYGYQIPDSAEKHTQVAIAFQRHFRQDDISGIWDNECEALLDMLLNK